MKNLALFLMAFGFGARLLQSALPTPDGDNGGLILPAGFRALIVADDLMTDHKQGKGNDNLRFLAVTASGDLYAKIYRGGGIIGLRDADGDGRFEQKEEFPTPAGTGIAVHDGWLYHSSNTAVFRYRLTPGKLVPEGEAEEIVTGLIDGGTHNAKSFTFDDEGHLLVEVGSPVNAYSDGDRRLGAKGKDATEFLQTHGGFWRFDANKLHQTLADGLHFSTGHRHSLAVAWQPVSRQFFMIQMGRDNLNDVAPDFYDALDNAERVAEEMHRLHEGVNLGWPYTYWDPIKKARMVAPEFGGDNRLRAEVGKYDEPVIAFPAHWAPLQMAFYTGSQFPEKYRGGAFIAFHGSWNRGPLPQQGYNIVFAPFDEKGEPRGTFEVFASSLKANQFRMGGVAVAPDGSLYVSETNRGRIWQIIYTGEAAAPVPVTPVAALTSSLGQPVAAPPVADTAGKVLYNQFCASCHMADGVGAGQMQPALLDSPVVKGDAGQLVRVLLKGPAAVLPAERPKYTNLMPAFPNFSNQEAAGLLTYVRQAFGGGASAISAEQVARER